MASQKENNTRSSSRGTAPFDIRGRGLFDTRLDTGRIHSKSPTRMPSYGTRSGSEGMVAFYKEYEARRTKNRAEGASTGGPSTNAHEKTSDDVDKPAEGEIPGADETEGVRSRVDPANMNADEAKKAAENDNGGDREERDVNEGRKNDDVDDNVDDVKSENESIVSISDNRGKKAILGPAQMRQSAEFIRTLMKENPGLYDLVFPNGIEPFQAKEKEREETLKEKTHKEKSTKGKERALSPCTTVTIEDISEEDEEVKRTRFITANASKPRFSSKTPGPGSQPARESVRASSQVTGGYTFNAMHGTNNKDKRRTKHRDSDDPSSDPSDSSSSDDSPASPRGFDGDSSDNSTESDSSAASVARNKEARRKRRHKKKRENAKDSKAFDRALARIKVLEKEKKKRGAYGLKIQAPPKYDGTANFDQFERWTFNVDTYFTLTGVYARIAHRDVLDRQSS
ncbi:hypothetical protein BOTBODRAFT_178718 [Botryobasidium botryosum FD-172 SS1]|uniref:Uncharacterized protein n=1 Tax=Botryobasidium botryosum (strain FD-172 SS1) TaxID=930990 RepID=A0A067M224_BOTB1|nr:hypothetical protein BOTBODRAFT_178718 [Botryobasidium botryosum FD-172 SS1]